MANNLIISNHDEFLNDERLRSFLGCQSRESLLSTITNHLMPAFLSKQNVSIRKFQAARLLAVAISDHQLTRQDILQSSWIKELRDEIFTIFQNRLNDQLRDPILSLTAELCLKCDGFDWMKLSDGWNDENTKFFRLLLELMAIEIEICLMSNDSPSQRYARCLVIFEHQFYTLIKNVDATESVNDELKLTPQQTIDAIRTIRKTTGIIVGFLKQLSDINDDISIDSKLFEMAAISIRYLCSYFQEEREQISEQELMRMMPFIGKMLNRETGPLQTALREKIFEMLRTYFDADEHRFQKLCNQYNLK